MPKVVGIGGVFFKAKGDPRALSAWYQEYLGIQLLPWGGGIFHWADDKGARDAATAWSIDGASSPRFSGGDGNFVINYRVEDIAGMIDKLKTAGTQILGEPELSGFGWFASFVDPEGNKVELWEPRGDMAA